MCEIAPKSPSDRNNGRPICIFFSKPGFLTGFCSNAKGFHESCESMTSPTSILDGKPFSGLGTYFWSEKRVKSPEFVSESKRYPRVGLGLVDALDQGTNAENGESKQERKMVLFGSQLKIQIPPRKGSPVFRSPIPMPCRSNCESPGVFDGHMTPREMELSEDYTCVIARGSNPRTTHIYGDRIVQSSAVEYPASGKKSPLFPSHRADFPTSDFLRFCHACRKKLGDNDDIFMYRGEKAFCSGECRYQEIIFDEENQKLASHLFATRALAHCREIFESHC